MSHKIFDTVHDINLVTAPCNLLITGICRTGKTTLAIRLMKELLEAGIPVTLIDVINTGVYAHEYKELFETTDYQHSEEKEFVASDSLLSGVKILNNLKFYNHLNIKNETDRLIAALQERLELFEKSFLFVEDPSHFSDQLQDFLSKVVRTGRKDNVYSVHIMQNDEFCAVPTALQFDQTITLKRLGSGNY